MAHPILTKRPVPRSGRLLRGPFPTRTMRNQRPAPRGVDQYLANVMRRKPELGSIVRPFSRLEKMPSTPLRKEGQLFDFLSGKKQAPRLLEPIKNKMSEMVRRKRRPMIDTEERRPLSIEERQRNPIVLVGNETIHRNALRQFKEMIVDERFGLQGTILHMATQFPGLAEVLRDPLIFREFVEKQVPRVWRVRLLKLLNESPELRAVALLLYLQVAFKNSRKTRLALRQMRREQRAA